MGLHIHLNMVIMFLADENLLTKYIFRIGFSRYIALVVIEPAMIFSLCYSCLSAERTGIPKR